MATANGENTYLWLAFTLMTVMLWGLYGLFLHNGQMGMADAVNGRYKAFLIVGLAYFLTAVLAPIVVLIVKGAAWTFPTKGLSWSLLAGLVGAGGAFCVLLAFGAKGTPPSVMTIVFAGAPIINAVVALLLHPPQGGFTAIRPAFFLGIVLAVVGAALVTLNKPKPSAGPAHVPNINSAQGQAHD
jgi:drug/metabolite transporter (DMT)-like permease